MAVFDTWGGSWLATWLTSWFPEEIITIGPITSQVIFKMSETTGNIGDKETLGIFREPSDIGRLKP